ncbi:hypothetical protein HDU67_007874 [Dinochytrium kinnereticum]|nr:hypothetical protein HDU67_007874 [Dinochytrium kinnereticum]
MPSSSPRRTRKTHSTSTLFILSSLLLVNSVVADTQGYYKGCHGKWQFNSNFRQPVLQRKFSARPQEFKSVDCAIVCKTINDYAFLHPDPTDATKTICSCVASTDPSLVYNLANVPGTDDTLCNVRCSDRERCGGVDSFGVKHSIFLIADPAPSRASPPLSPAVVAALEVEAGPVNANTPPQPTSTTTSPPPTDSPRIVDPASSNPETNVSITPTSTPTLAIALGASLSVIVVLIVVLGYLYMRHRRTRRTNLTPFHTSSSPTSPKSQKHLLPPTPTLKSLHATLKAAHHHPATSYDAVDSRRDSVTHVSVIKPMDIQIETTTRGWAAGGLRESVATSFVSSRDSRVGGGGVREPLSAVSGGRSPRVFGGVSPGGGVGGSPVGRGYVYP